MKVALIGATGFVGSHLLQELLHRNYDVTAIARSTSKIPVQDGKPKVIAADVTDAKKITELLKGSDVVISAFNAGWTNPNLYDDFLKGSKAIERAVEQAGVRRFIVVGGGGSLFINDKQIVDGPNFPAEIKPGAAAARDYLNVLKENEKLDWTYFSPALDMYPGERTGRYRLGTENPVFNTEGKAEISVQDAAVAIVDEIENNKFVRQRFTVGY